jgi:hypothetical protein
LYDLLQQYKGATEGEMMRILEIAVPKDNEMEKALADELFSRTLPTNYGLACEPYMQYVVPNRTEVVKQLIAEQKQLDQRMHIDRDQKERFYSACIASALTGGRIANQLGIIDIPVDNIIDWVYEVLLKTRRQVKDAIAVTDGGSCSSNLARYWNATKPNIVIVNGSAGTEVDDKLMNQPSLKPVVGAVKGREERDTKRLFLAESDIKAWLIAQRLGVEDFFDLLKAAPYYIDSKPVNLGEGTVCYSGAKVPAIILDIDKLVEQTS